jgi:FAD:protein FMN transferase
MRPLLGTFVELGAVPNLHRHSAANVQQALDLAFAQIELVQQLLSFHSASSDLTRLNSAAGQWVLCHPLSIQCLRLARAATRASAQRFNCMLGYALVRAGALPAHNFASIYGANLLAVGNWQDLHLSNNSARLCRPVLISLDGIAKGFAVDIAIKSLKNSGINSGWVNAGGDIRCFGSALLPIVIRDHLQQQHPLGGLQNAAIATSSTQASIEFPSLLLTQTGQPQAAATWSVMATSAWRADALTKVAANSPAAERAQFVRSLGGTWIPLTSNTPNESVSIITSP